MYEMGLCCYTNDFQKLSVVDVYVDVRTYVRKTRSKTRARKRGQSHLLDNGGW